MANPANVSEYLWAAVDRDTRIRWVALGHTMSPAPGETEAVSHARWMWAAQQVDTYDTYTRGEPVAPWILSRWPIPAGSQAGPPPSPPTPPAPPTPPSPPLPPDPPQWPYPLPPPPAAGQPCPVCHHSCPKP